jgi:hypothetical protein
VQSKKVPLPKAILPTIRIWCLGTSLRSPHSYGRMGGDGRQGGAQSRTGGTGGSGGKIGSLGEGFLSKEQPLIRTSRTRAARGCRSTAAIGSKAEPVSLLRALGRRTQDSRLRDASTSVAGGQPGGHGISA